MERRTWSHLPPVIILGIVGQTGQVVVLRELLMVFHGNELALGVILAAWMLWVGVGSRLGAALSDRIGRPLVALSIASVGVTIVLPATIAATRLLRGLFPVGTGAYLSITDMAISCVLVTAPTAIALGLQFVLLSRAWRESLGSFDTSTADRTYIGEALGSLAGGMLFSLFLVRHADPFRIVALAGLAMTGSTLLIVSRDPRAAARPHVAVRRAMAALLVLIGASWPFLGRFDAWMLERQWSLFAAEYELIEARRSRYGTVAVASRDDQYSYFQSGHLVFSTASDASPTAVLEEQEAALFAHASLVQHERPDRVLLIGGGMRGTLREVLRHPVGAVDYVELDTVMTDAARAHASRSTLATLEDSRVRLIHADGRLFLKTAERSYDAILMDLPDPATAVLNRFYTVEFFGEVREKLDPGGVFVLAVTSTADLRDPALANRNSTIYHTLRSVFPSVVPVGERQVLFFCGDAASALSWDPWTLASRYADRGVSTQGFTPASFRLLFLREPLERLYWILRNHGRGSHLDPPPASPLFPGSMAEQEREELEQPAVDSPWFINSDFRPIGYFYTLLYWSALTRGGRSDLLPLVLRVRPWWGLVPAGLALCGVAVARYASGRRGRRPDARPAVLLAVFTTGLSTMALQIALLFTFQSVYGFVYEMVGLIVALFMGGLAAGTAIVHRWVPDRADMRLLGLLQLVIVVFAVLVGALLPAVAKVRSPQLVLLLFGLCTVVAGLLNGADFPVAVACYFSARGKPEAATGTVYGVELFGACAGSVLASVVIAPVFGIVACCLLAAGANAVSCAGVLIQGRVHG